MVFSQGKKSLFFIIFEHCSHEIPGFPAVLASLGSNSDKMLIFLWIRTNEIF